MNKIQLRTLNMKVGDMNVLKNNVCVYFEYEIVDKKSIALFLTVYVGENEKNYRIYLEIVVWIELDRFYYDEKQLIEEGLNLSIDQLMDIIFMFDSLLEKKK